MGLRGREHVSVHYSREVVSAKYDALIRAVASGTLAGVHV
jgi:hypothetical protein